MAVASFAPKCKKLLIEIAALEKEYDESSSSSSSSCCGPPSPLKPLVIVISTDDDDDLEELAIELGLNDVPSFQIYKGGQVVVASDSSTGSGAGVTIDIIRNQLKNAAISQTSSSSAGGGGCCPPKSSSNNNSVACCPDGSNTANAPTDPAEILRLVQQSYARTVNLSYSNNNHNSRNIIDDASSGGGGGGCCTSAIQPSTLGYTQAQILQAGTDANLGLGCGNPISFANLQPGETVVDLGSGAGVNCFLAGDVVGKEGKIIGVDMTPDMVFRARQNASKRNNSNSNSNNNNNDNNNNNASLHNNVEFHLGEIEHLPIPNGIVDCVISNCVINLSPDKPQVFREIYRILKPNGGRVAISVVVIRPQKVIPTRLMTAEALAC